MGIVSLFMSLAVSLKRSPALAYEGKLEQPFDDTIPFAYIGNRRSLVNLVLPQMSRIRERVMELDTSELENLASSHSPLAEVVSRLGTSSNRRPANYEDMARIVYGLDSQKDSGAYPDFIPSLNDTRILGDGAVLELKDSVGQQIASFNSTIPTRFKSLQEIRQITKSNLAVNSTILSDLPHSLKSDYLGRDRNCFYLVRTNAKHSTAFRISVVEGSFFETIPKKKLLGAVWSQILTSAGFTEIDQARLIEPLSQLEQQDIAQSRTIENASVKPRFRIMTEAHSEGNPHNYGEIPPGTLNLIVKQESPDTKSAFENLTGQERIRIVKLRPERFGFKVEVNQQGQALALEVLTVRHKRNGDHLVVQYRVSSSL